MRTHASEEGISPTMHGLIGEGILLLLCCYLDYHLAAEDPEAKLIY